MTSGSSEQASQGTVEAPVVAPAGGPKAAPLRAGVAKALEWLTRRDALGEAMRHAASSAGKLPFLHRARAASRAGDALLDPPDASRSNPSAAMTLFHDAAYWLAKTELPRAVTGSPVAPLPAVLADYEAGTFAELALETQLGAARGAQRWLASALDAAELEGFAVTRLRVERFIRLVFAAAVVAGILFGIGNWISNLGNLDFARGKPWRASSTYDTCDPEKHRCAGHRTDIFFHTQDDASPWLEIDLQRNQRFSRVDVRNRSDLYPERAVPLVIEVSTDGTNFWQVAQKKDSFDVWKAKFAPQVARYVRLRATRKTFLHLERVAVRP